MSSFVFHSSLLTVKSVDLWLHVMASFALEVVHVFNSGYLDYLKLNIADKDTSVSDDNRGPWHHGIFHSSYFDYRCIYFLNSS